MAYRPLTNVPVSLLGTSANFLNGGTLYAYLAGTSTPTDMYQDSSGTSAGPEVTLDSRGEPTGFKLIWLDESVSYKLILKDSAGVTIWTVDDISVGAATGAIRIFSGDNSGATDVTALIQQYADFGDSLLFPSGQYKFSTVNITTLGQVIYGAGMTQTVFNLVSGGKGFVIRARNQTYRDFSFIPPGYTTGTQSSTVADCFTVQEASSDENYIEGLLIERVGCYNYKGCAVRMISPLRESVIEKCRFHGMSNKSTGDGVIHMDNPSTSDRSPNNLYIKNNSVYRFGAPFVNFKVSGTSATGRDQPPYADIYIMENLIHGQLLDETAVPSPLSVSPEECDHIYIKGIENVSIKDNKFAAIHPNYWGVRIDSFTAYAVNKAVRVEDNYMSYGSTVPAIGSPSGGYIRCQDAVNFKACNNDVYAGYFTADILHEDTATHSTTLISRIFGNQSTNHLQLAISAPDYYVNLTRDRLEIYSADPRLRMKAVDGGAANIYADITVDGAASIILDADPNNAHSATQVVSKIDGANELVVSGGQIAVNRINFLAAVSAGSVNNNCIFRNAADGKLYYKDNAGTSNALY